MSVKIFDTMTTATPNFPLAYAEKINIVKEDGSEADIQTLYNNGELGGGGDSSTTLTQEEYEALTEEQKLDGLYYTYDTKRIYKNGVQYGASEPIPLTMEEYKALKEAGAIDEQQEYLISANTEGILLGAEDIGYSNAVSNLPCTTVQGAIDELSSNLGEKADKSYVDDNFATMDKVESKYSEENVLTSTDWNTLNTRARYYFSGGTPMTNSPEVVPFGLLEVINVGSYCRIQRYFAFNGKLYIRRWSGNSWNEWYRFDGISI